MILISLAVPHEREENTPLFATSVYSAICLSPWLPRLDVLLMGFASVLAEQLMRKTDLHRSAACSKADPPHLQITLLHCGIKTHMFSELYQCFYRLF